MTGQMCIPGIPAPEPHANRGMVFEGMLGRTHDYYLRLSIAYVEKLPNAWRFCSEGEWKKLADELKARTGDGRPLKREKTSCDYIGTARSRGVAFEAKEFAGSALPMRNFQSHQLHRLFLKARVGSLAGSLVYAKRVDEVFWLDADTLYTIYNLGRPKSLNIDWLKRTAVFISAGSADVIDWVTVLLGVPTPANFHTLKSVA